MIHTCSLVVGRRRSGLCSACDWSCAMSVWCVCVGTRQGMQEGMWDVLLTLRCAWFICGVLLHL